MRDGANTEAFYVHPLLPYLECRRSTNSGRHYREHTHSAFSVGAIDEGSVSFKVGDELGTLTPEAKSTGLFLQGVLVTVPNPKSLIFIAAFVPQFVKGGRPRRSSRFRASGWSSRLAPRSRSGILAETIGGGCRGRCGTGKALGDAAGPLRREPGTARGNRVAGRAGAA